MILLALQVTEPSNILLWGYAKDAVFMLQLPTDIPRLESRITEKVKLVTRIILSKAWD
jgi:hypothetical protein